MHCPSCQAYQLEPCAYNGRQVGVCPRCGGLWCDVVQWKGAGWAELSPEPDATTVSASGTLGVRLCGQCHATLAIVPVPEVEGLQLERCVSCNGVWFDRGEWEKFDALQAWKGQIAELERPTTWGEWFFQMFLRLPIEFNIRPHRTPWMTLAIIAVCTVVTILQMDPEWDEKAMSLAVHGRQALTWSGVETLITYQFLHAGWLHLLPNLYLLYILGDNVEDVLGPLRFLLFYLTCGAAAAVTQILGSEMFGPALPLVGASGAIAGVIAAYLILFRRSRLTFLIIRQHKPPAWVWITVWLLIQLLAVRLDPSGNLTGIAFWAHIGGFAAGAILILPFRSRLIASHPLLDLLDKYRLRPPPRDTVAENGKDAAPASS